MRLMVMLNSMIDGIHVMTISCLQIEIEASYLYNKTTML